MKKNWSAGVIIPSTLRRSMVRRAPSAGLVTKLAGKSVKGTSTSPCASAGSAHSGTRASAAAVVKPSLRVSRRVISFIVVPQQKVRPGRTRQRRMRPPSYRRTWSIIAPHAQLGTHVAPLADRGAAGRAGADPGPRLRVLVVHHGPDQRVAATADRADRSQPAGFPSASANSERSQSTGAVDARHARWRRTVPDLGLVRAV